MQNWLKNGKICIKRSSSTCRRFYYFLLSNVTWVAILFINDFGAFICDDMFCASLLFCILTPVYDIE